MLRIVADVADVGTGADAEKGTEEGMEKGTAAAKSVDAESEVFLHREFMEEGIGAMRRLSTGHDQEETMPSVRRFYPIVFRGKYLADRDNSFSGRSPDGRSIENSRSELDSLVRYIRGSGKERTLLSRYAKAVLK